MSQAALKSIAASVGCGEINAVEQYEFYRLWVWAAVVSAAVVLAVVVPLFWCCAEPRAADFLDADELRASEEKRQAEAAAAKEAQKRLDEEQIEINLGNDPTPNIEAARAHLKKTSPTDGEQNWRSMWRTRLSIFHEIGGTGTKLYFRLLRDLGIAFVFMVALTAPICGYNVIGNFAPDTGQNLLKTTIGNLGHLTSPATLSPQSRYVILGCQGALLYKLTTCFSWLDWTAIMLFLGTVLHFRFLVVPRTEKEDDERSITCPDFAICIDKLPRMIDNQEEYAERLTKMIEKRMITLREEMRVVGGAPPQVAEVVLVRDHQGRLGMMRDRAEMVLRQNIARDKSEWKNEEKLESRIKKLTEHLEQTLVPDEISPVVRAYVIVSTPGDADRLVFDYRFSKYSWLRLFQKRAQRFEGFHIRIQRAPEPTNIIWFNQDVPWLSRLFRQLIMGLIWLLLIAISLVLIYATSAAAASQSSTQLSYLGAGGCDPVQPTSFSTTSSYKCLVSTAKAWNMSYVKSLSDSDITNCYCQTTGYSAIIGSADLLSLCGPWILSSVKSTGITILASVIVVVINILVKTVLIMMAYFEKPVTESDLTRAVTRKIAVAQIVNTGFIGLLVNYSAPPDLRAAINRFPLGGQLIFAGAYPDFVRSWYSTVGAGLLMNMATNALTTPVLNVVFWSINSCYRSCRWHKYTHQAELLELYTNPAFELSFRFAQLLMTVFVTLTYSSGMPALYLFAAFYMLFTYWSDKLILLWGSQRPPAFDASGPKEVADGMLFAIPMHCLFALLMYGQPCVFPSIPLGFSSTLPSVEASNSAASWVYFRISRESTWMFFVLLVIFVALWVLRGLYFVLAGSIGKLLMVVVERWCPRRVQVVPDEEEETLVWSAWQARIERESPPASYVLERSPQFLRLQKYWQLPEEWRQKKQTEYRQSIATAQPYPVVP